MAAIEGKQRKNHLVVLVHGLWGSAQNLARLESVLHHGLENSDACSIHTYLPACFSHFKTYDGVESIGNYVIQDLFDHLKKLKDDHGIVIDQISFIGYSLGGLICRYIVGQLYSIGFFDTIQPAIFSTMATPHLGSHFYSHNVLNVLGSHLLGQTGKDLFMVEGRDGILYKMSEKESVYMKGLELFKTRICVANTKFDRTVGFYSAFITKYDPFAEWDKVEPTFIGDLPTATIKENNTNIECMIVDFQKTKRVPEGTSSPHETPDLKRPILLISVVAFFVFPIIFTVSTFATVKSKFRTHILGRAELKGLWEELEKYLLEGSSDSVEASTNIEGATDSSLETSAKDLDDSYDEEENMEPNPIGVSHITRKLVEDGLTALEGDEYEEMEEVEKTLSKTGKTEAVNSESFNIDLEFAVNYTTRSVAVDNLLQNANSSDLGDVPVTEGLDPLPFSAVREEILNNLNSLQWTKIAVLLHSLNAHQSVVGRRGFERTTESVPLLFLYTFLFEESMKRHNEV